MTDEYTGDLPRLKIRHALLPITAVACFLLGIATTLREPAPTLALDEVVAMKPVEGEDQPPVFAAAKTYKYRCPKCKLIQEYGTPGVKKCPNDGKTMIREN